ncbi:hypothetical protein E2562_030866 [Oryza meyeriana var. granulata]|uniref:Uncharacterized protein n=1 Tax=Oryza meyeriana var. granulata TaxID=110450 RepID=A0A6G1F025_9ORYZ|nr:hypothetical protein E2562_030866 [Oryza meyeriana var. granulata]
MSASDEASSSRPGALTATATAFSPKATSAPTNSPLTRRLTHFAFSTHLRHAASHPRTAADLYTSPRHAPPHHRPLRTTAS